MEIDNQIQDINPWPHVCDIWRFQILSDLKANAGETAKLQLLERESSFLYCSRWDTYGRCFEQSDDDVSEAGLDPLRVSSRYKCAEWTGSSIAALGSELKCCRSLVKRPLHVLCWGFLDHFWRIDILETGAATKGPLEFLDHFLSLDPVHRLCLCACCPWPFSLSGLTCPMWHPEISPGSCGTTAWHGVLPATSRTVARNTTPKEKGQRHCKDI